MIRKIIRIMAAGLVMTILLPGATVNAQAASGTADGAFKPLSQVAMEAMKRQEDHAADNTEENVVVGKQLSAAEKKADESDGGYAMSEVVTAEETVKEEVTVGDASGEADTPGEAEVKEETDGNELAAALVNAVAEESWQGAKLSRNNGTVKGPSGKETYYNLNMQKIVNDIKSHGWIWHEIDPSLHQNVSGDYHIREDGCKMLGPFIMVAANLRVHPRGSLVETSLGTGVVVDTGAFARSNTQQIDVAVNW